MKTLLLFLALFVSHLGFSQNRVVKDNLACLYGIKNSEGAWVVQPKYILLTGYSYGYFVTQEGPNYGLLAPDGTEILPCEYNRIKPLSHSWQPHGLGQPAGQTSTGRTPILFQVDKNAERALIDGLGNTIVALDTQFFRTDGQDHVIITKYRNPNHFTSYIDLQGNYIFKDLPGAMEPFKSHQIALIGLRTPGSNGTVEGNVRVINKKGEFIGTQPFNRAIICGQGHIVFEDSAGHVGTMDMTGRTIIHPRYALVVQSYSRENILPCLYSAQHTFVIKDDLGKLGLMDGAGNVICPPEYDDLERLNGQWKTAHTAYRIRNNGKIGMLRENGTVSIPCNYDTLIPFKIHYNGNLPLDGFIVSEAGKFGLIKTDGESIIPLEHPFFQYAPRSRSVLFGNSKELSEITLVDNKMHIAPIEKLIQLTDYSVFKGENDSYFVLKELETGSLEIIRSERYMNVLSFYEGRNKAILMDLSGNRLDDGNVHSINQKFRFISASTEDGNYLIDTKTATRLTEPSQHSLFRVEVSSMEQVWSIGVVEPRDSWVLLDTLGQPSGTDSFDQPFNLNREQVPVLQNGYWGIYNVAEKKWQLSPKYTCIDVISQKVFRTHLQNGKWELHSLDAKTFYGPFESLDLLFNAHDYNSYGSGSVVNCLFLAKQNGTSFLIDGNGKKITNATEIKRIQMELAYGIYDYHKINVFTLGLKIEQNKPDFMVTSLYEQLYDIITETIPNPSGTNSLMSVDERNCACKRSTESPLRHEISYATPNATSVTVSRYYQGQASWDVGSYKVQGYINAILVKGQLKEIELRAIFGYKDELLYSEFTRAIQADERLNLECSTVNNMLEIIGNNFMFSEEGLVLVVQQNSRRSVNVTIPWKRLAEVPTTKSFAGIFID